MRDRLITIAISVAATMGLMKADPQKIEEMEVDRLIVRKELIVSDTGKIWEDGYEEHQIPRGVYAKTLADGPGGLWVRSRLIKAEVDDPFDDRFHAVERDGSLRTTPGHISWNVWLDGAWRQMAIVQGEGLDMSEVPRGQWNGTTHPGRIRFQTFRPGHQEPLTDALVGQGKMSLGGGGYGGGGLPDPSHILDLWGGTVETHSAQTPTAPRVLSDDGSGKHEYALIAVDAEGRKTLSSPSVAAKGLATLAWDSVSGADAYVVVRDGEELTAVRIEGAEKRWEDTAK